MIKKIKKWMYDNCDVCLFITWILQMLIVVTTIVSACLA